MYVHKYNMTWKECMYQMLLKDRIALVTGGAMGIGRAIAADMANEGAKVIILDVAEKEGHEAAAEINSKGGKAFFFKCDVTNLAVLQNTADKIADTIGAVDILVANAGVSLKKEFEDIDEDLWDSMTDVNLKSSFLTVKAFLSHIKASKYGKIIFITSASAYTGTGGGIFLAASKAGQNAMVLNLAKTLGPLGINVNGIAPRVIRTNNLDNLYPTEESKQKLIKEIPIRKIGEPEDIGYLASFIASDKAGYLHGQIIIMDGGRTFQ